MAQKTFDLSWIKKHKSILLLSLFVGIGIYTRLSGTIHGFFAFTYDQGKDFLALDDIVNGRHLTLIGPTTGIDGVFHGVWWYWLLVPLFWIFKGDPVWLVASFNLISAASIVLAFILGKELVDERLGLILAGLMSVSPFYISTGAQLWHPNLVPLLMLLLLISLVKYQKGRWPWFWVAAVLGAIFEFELAAGILFVPVFGLTLVLTRQLPKMKQLILGGAGFGFWLIPRLVFEMRHSWIQTYSLFKFLTHPTLVNQMSLLVRLSDRIQTITNLLAYAFVNSNKLIGIILLIMIMAGGKEISKQKTLRFLLVLICLLGINLVIYQGTLWEYYINMFPTLVLPLIGMGLYIFVKKYRIWGGVIISSLLLYNLAPWRFFAKPWAGDASSYKNEIRVVETVYQRASGKPFNVQVYSPSVIDYNYHYLFKWYGNKEYAFTADRDDEQATVFYIIEPDPWKTGRLRSWLAEREGDGQLIWQQIFPGEIEVWEKLRVMN